LKTISDICLGTAKLGLPDYGFPSSYKKSKFIARDYLEQLGSLGVVKFDTSPRYGNSEEILGRYIKSATLAPFISSKIDKLKLNNKKSNMHMLSSVKSSLQKLNKEYLDVCYLHQHHVSIIKDSYIQDGLMDLKSLGLIKNIGVSIYTIDECKAAIEAEIFDYIQIPTSIIDTSIYSNYIKDQSKKVKFVARSIFLQGSIFNKNKIINKIIDGEMLLEAIKSIEFLAKQNNLTLASLALGFVGSLKNIDHIIMGSLSLNNMKKNIALLNLSLPQDLIEKILKISNKTASWKNPQNWGY